jgi:tRNA-dihydrouridine synthase B
LAFAACDARPRNQKDNTTTAFMAVFVFKRVFHAMEFSLGDIRIDTPVFLAPMTGVTDLPFRRMVKRYGAGLVFSEMIASRPMLEQYRQDKGRVANYAEEFPMAVQLAGCEPDLVAEAAKVNVDRGAAIIDINFGCPVKKVVNNFAGSALMKDEKLAAQIMEATVRAVNVPVTVKMRLGWDETNLNAANLARIAQDVGIKMVTVHGRTRNQLYNGTADWRAVADVKKNVSIPVIVNGDILSADDAQLALEQSGADGVMIGRGTYGKPWLVKQVIDYFQTGSIGAEPSLQEIGALVLEHYQAMIDHYGEFGGVGIARKHIGWYCKDMSGSNDLRTTINAMADSKDVLQVLDQYFKKLIGESGGNIAVAA